MLDRTDVRLPARDLRALLRQHGLLQVAGRPQWFSVRGGSRSYVDRIVASLADVRVSQAVRGVAPAPGGRVAVHAVSGTEYFDRVVLATHSDQSLALLAGADAGRGALLRAIRYQPNHAVLHTDAAVLPADRRARAAWNYHASATADGVAVHYLINRLRPLPFETPVIVSLNSVQAIDPRLVISRFDYAHPLFDRAAIDAQAGLARVQRAAAASGWAERGPATGSTRTACGRVSRRPTRSSRARGGRIVLPRECSRERGVAALAIGEVRHARHRPRRHVFRYPALFVRLPMHALDASLAGRRLFSRNRFDLFSFHDADHGDPRTRNDASPARLSAWITDLLAGEGVVDAGGALWLQAFPRVLGYALRPVSFWFCHRADGALRAVVCEINNTFGERHCYLLAHRDGTPIGNGEALSATKVFRVSPFCAVSGGYRFRFMDVEGALITASLSGRLAPLREAALLAAFVRHPLFSFGVIARIHWQALRLWLKRTPSFRKPDPPTIEVSR